MDDGLMDGSSQERGSLQEKIRRSLLSLLRSKLPPHNACLGTGHPLPFSHPSPFSRSLNMLLGTVDNAKGVSQRSFSEFTSVFPLLFPE